MGSGGEGYPGAVGGDSDERAGEREFPAWKGAVATVENRGRKTSSLTRWATWVSLGLGECLSASQRERDIWAQRGLYEGKRRERQPRTGPSMNRNAITKQIAVTAGFL